MRRVALYNINGSYMLDLGYTDMVMIDGERYNVIDKAWLPNKPTEAYLLRTARRPSCYGELTPSEYEIQSGNLRNGHVVYDSDGCEKWDTLENEFSYRKFVNEHPVTMEEYEEREPIEFLEINISGRTDNKYIKPLRLLGKIQDAKEDECLYSYSPNAYEMAVEIGLELGITAIHDWQMDRQFPNDGKLYFSVPDHSKDDLEFMQINKKYVHHNFKRLTSFRGIAIGKWDECEKAYRDNCNAIRSVFQNAINENNKGAIPNIGQTVETLNQIENKIMELSFSRKNEGDRSYILKMIRELKNGMTAGLKTEQ
jgi:hypothetical protein